ncbi:hypothetical protein IW261DRAFT_177955 [Armillaria novae-zelandiae]|uniref:Heterokaryon incompatibility domain-containing protein n=1 Tax=Armillaria novae-zelandiae TaxID=153914 RepID=A0AA39TXZ0_9AGAR|nr:hypothetical protein IW261DRAFT_177955 [Armillaria novae-zelandiae]
MLPPTSFPPNPRKRFIFKDTIWLGGIHDGYPFTSFSEYMKVRGAPSPDSDPTTYAALYQSLFTFGLLESVMEVKIPESTLLCQDAEGKIVMTDRYLSDLLQNWQDRIRQSDKTCQWQWANRVQMTLWQMYDFLLTDIINERYRVFLKGRDTSIYWLIGCIAEAMTSSRRVFPFLAQMQNAPLSWTFLLPPGFDHTAKCMISNGWCPFIIAILADEMCALSYASTRQPYIRDNVEGHHKCTMSACVINTIDTSSYSNRHSVKGCTCAYSKPSLERVCRSLEHREIPVVHQLQPNDGLISSDGSKTRYIAISHVWADGLGSTTEIGLPTCQINRLAGIARRLIPSGAFWMDALCVPEKRDLRRRAIGLMAETYRNADAVLVIDSGIRSCSRSAPLEERLLQIISSGWMQRLWTLQEALLARKLIFEFADGFSTLDELIPIQEEDLLDVLLTQLSAEIFRLTKYQRYATSNGFGIGDVAQSLRWRTTSRAGDETLAISGLLNVDAFELVNLPASQRMTTLLLRVRKLPSNIIFMPGPKLNQSCFRWAPRTMMTSMRISMTVSGQYEALCTPQGLIAEYSAVCFADITLKRDAPWFIRDKAKQRIYRIADIKNYIEEYSCSVLLLMRLPRPSETVHCIACRVVGGEAPPEDADGYRFTCEYQRRLILTDISESDLAKEKADTVLGATSGRMRVLMT